MTGRENIYMNAAILGMTEAEADAKFDEIVDFAEIGKFLDSPVGSYSSGMFARLGFSVAVKVDCDVFIIDEVLAVGDPPFKKKCIKRMEESATRAVTLFFVSHATQCAPAVHPRDRPRGGPSASTAMSTRASSTSTTTTTRSGPRRGADLRRGARLRDLTANTLDPSGDGCVWRLVVSLC